MENFISEATKKNWNKLGVDSKDKLTSRANKILSKKTFIPREYINNKNIMVFIEHIIKKYKDYSIPEIIFSIAISILKKEGILYKENVKYILNEFNNDCKSDLKIFEESIPEYEGFEDILGAIYQSLLSEGEKNKKGSYFTPKNIVKDMILNLNFSSDSKFLDPCCGSGSFLLNIECENPNNLYGVEKDEISAFISKINLIIKYKSLDFIPNIICSDFIESKVFEDKGILFDFIATNPPWGNKTKITTEYINSKESFTQFFVKSYSLLKNNGEIVFLFPESILNVKTHKDIREFILNNQDLYCIKKYGSSFTEVVTDVVSLHIKKGKRLDSLKVIEGNNSFYVDYTAFKLTNNKVFSLLENEEIDLINKALKKSKYSLESSKWGLGIVTGDNKNKIHKDYKKDYEKIYTGKDILKYKLKEASAFILYDRRSLQQVASDEIYRASEKLVYRFVSKKLIFAYDNTASLFLNSANILVPNIPKMSTKTVMAFLNSKFYQMLYEKLFGELKVLKGNLSELPFPEISPEVDEKISKMIDRILYENIDMSNEIDKEIYKVFGLSEREIEKVEGYL